MHSPCYNDEKGERKMRVYLDIAFFVNFIFDAEILFLMLTITSKKITYKRLIFAALLGGLQGVFVFFPYFRILSLPPVSFLVSLLMVFIAAKPSTKREFFENYLIFLMTSFLFGGVMTFLKLRAVFSTLLILPVYLGILKIRQKIFKKRTRITLCYKGKNLERDAVYDSGNTVFYFGKPVIFGSKRLFCDILDRDLSDMKYEDFCLVPYKCVGKSGIAKGIRLDKAVVSDKNFDGTVFCYFDEDLNDEVILNGVMV